MNPPLVGQLTERCYSNRDAPGFRALQGSQRSRPRCSSRNESRARARSDQSISRAGLALPDHAYTGHARAATAARGKGQHDPRLPPGRHWGSERSVLEFRFHPIVSGGAASTRTDTCPLFRATQGVGNDRKVRASPATRISEIHSSWHDVSPPCVTIGAGWVRRLAYDGGRAWPAGRRWARKSWVSGSAIAVCPAAVG